MPTYNKYPAVDSGYNFPPEVREAVAAAQELKDVFMPLSHGTLPNGTWLNNLINPGDVGIYTLLDSYSYTNAPSGVSGTGVLEVYRGSGGSAVLQRLTISASVFWRESISALVDSWSPWEQVQTKSSADTQFTDLKGLPLLPGTTDLNSLTVLGNRVYWVNVPADTTAAANQHFPTTAAGKLTSYFSGATNGIQTFESYTLTTKRYARIRNTGGWTEWSSIADDFDIKINDVKGLPLLPGTTDLDTLMTLGNQVRWVAQPVDAAAATAQHYPANTAGKVVTFFFGASNGIQTFESYSVTPKRFSRIRNSGGWAAWTSAESRLDVIELDNLTRDTKISNHETRLTETERILTNIAAIPEIAGNIMPDPVNPGFYLIGV